MAAIAGTSGNVKFSSDTVGQIDEWSLDLGRDSLDTTNFGSSGWKENIAGIKEFSASFSGNWDVATAATNQDDAQNALLNGTTVTLNLYVNGSNYYSGSAYIDSISVSTSAADKVTVSFSATGTGALTYN